MYFSGIEEIPYTYLIHFIEINASRPRNREDTYLSHPFHRDRRPDRLLYLENFKNFFKKTNSFQKFCKVIRKGVKNVRKFRKISNNWLQIQLGNFHCEVCATSCLVPSLSNIYSVIEIWYLYLF